MRALSCLVMVVLTACAPTLRSETSNHTRPTSPASDPSWNWHRQVAGWDLGAAPRTGRRLDGPIAPRFPVEFGVEPWREDWIDSHRPHAMWSRQTRSFFD